jgi:ATP-dependent helicase/nuclease subunit B
MGGEARNRTPLVRPGFRHRAKAAVAGRPGGGAAVAEARLNRLTEALRELCAEQALAEKWLLAPSRRIGMQWLDAVARSGQPVLNVRVESPRTMALLRLAAPALEQQGLTFLRGLRREVLIGRLFAQLRDHGEGYLSALEPGPGLTAALSRALRDLRLAGVTAAGLRAGSFEVAAKGRELQALLAAYEQQLRREHLADEADVLRLAAERLRSDPDALPAEALVLLPEDMAAGMRALERAVWEAIPERQRVVLPVDRPGEAPAEGLTDAALLRWIWEPVTAPLPAGDGTATIFRAVGEGNEVREVWRRCAAAGIPLDQVEILYTDPDSYLPLLYESACRLAPDTDEALHITFAEGIPARYSRPARALLGWRAWILDGYPQAALVRLMQEGLLRVGVVERGEHSYSGLASALRSLPIGGRQERYLLVIDRELAALGAGRSRPEAEDAEEDASPGAERIALLRVVRETIAPLVASELLVGSQRQVLRAALSFLETQARGAGQFDEYSRERLIHEVEELAQYVAEGDVPGLDAWDWLRDMTRGLRVEASGPRPGCVYAAPLLSGGHSGRPHTFLLGLDDGRFPGRGGQDPVLLDAERNGLSPDLPTASRSLMQQVRSFAELLARLRGQVTLSYCARSLADDHALYPGPAIWSAFRLLSGSPEASQEELEKWLPEPAASFAPRVPDRCTDVADWWLWRLCGAEGVEGAEAAIGASFPHLGRGFAAREARDSDLFTEYDGHVPEAGADHDPTRPEGPVLSAGRLEMMGTCPFEYFLRYVLEIAPAEEFVLDPSAWLTPADRGALMHRVLRDFMAQVQRRGGRPERRDERLLLGLLDRQIETYQRDRPPHNEEVFAREVRDLRRLARAFLTEEERLGGESQPVCVEACIGMLPPDSATTMLDTPEPVAMELPGGGAIRLRGRIDRVDQQASSHRFSIWDYKTGSSRRYAARDPFKQGRCLQGVVYCALADGRLREARPGAIVSRFGYLFLNPRDRGARLWWEAEQLLPGAHVVAQLCALMRGGCFPFTTDPADVRFSDYLSCYGDPEQSAAAAMAKAMNPRNEMLAPFCALREIDAGEA